jgi:hypothetical protein
MIDVDRMSHITKTSYISILCQLLFLKIAVYVTLIYIAISEMYITDNRMAYALLTLNNVHNIRIAVCLNPH